MVSAFIIGLSIALVRTTYLAWKFYNDSLKLISVNQDIRDNYQYLAEAWYDLCSDNDILNQKVAGLKREANLYWEDRQSLMNTVKILQGDNNVQ